MIAVGVERSSTGDENAGGPLKGMPPILMVLNYTDTVPTEHRAEGHAAGERLAKTGISFQWAEK